MELDKNDSASYPFLSSEIEEEYSSLLQQKRIFDINIKEMIQLTDNLSFEESSNVTLIKSKFENIENQMNKIAKKISTLQNLIPEDDFNMGLKTKILADNIQRKFKKANVKFQNAITSVQNCLEEELSFTSDFSTLEKSSEISNSMLNKEKIDRLIRTKKEYENIYNITNSLNQLSEEIKFNTINQGEKIDLTEENITFIEDNVFKGNDQLKKYHENNSGNNGLLYQFVTGVGIGILFLALMIYLKISSSSKELDFEASVDNA